VNAPLPATSLPGETDASVGTGFRTAGVITFDEGAIEAPPPHPKLARSAIKAPAKEHCQGLYLTI
jgi:hypothetical protein